MATSRDWSERFNLVLLGVVDKERSKDLRFVTGGVDYKLDAGDVLVVLGPTQEIVAFKREICVTHRGGATPAT